jgi:predicted nucleotidyltransferase
MSMTALDLSPEALKGYRPLEAIRRRKSDTGTDLSSRRRRARLTARKAAELLRSEFGASKVIIFGSLARRGGFTLWSDIDIAAQGIPPIRFFEAVGAIAGMSAEFKMDLIDLDTSPSSLREAIENEGKDL